MKKKTKILSSALISLSLLVACQADKEAPQETTPQTALQKYETREDLIFVQTQEIPKEKDDFVLTISEDEYPVDVDELEVTIENKSKIIITTGLHFRIDKLVDGIWYYFPFKDDIFNDIGTFIKPDTNSTDTYSLDRLEQALTPGEYRIVKSFSSEENAQDETEIILAAPFKIVE